MNMGYGMQFDNCNQNANHINLEHTPLINMFIAAHGERETVRITFQLQMQRDMEKEKQFHKREDKACQGDDQGDKKIAALIDNLDTIKH